MKKIKLLCAFALISFGSYFGFSVYENITMSASEKFLKRNIEALTETEPGSNGRYNKVKSDCTKTFAIDAAGYVTIKGKRIYIGGVSSSYTVTHSDAQIDCRVGSTYYTCTERTCEQYWNSNDL